MFDDTPRQRLLWVAAGVVLVPHAAIHVVGFLLLWHITELGDFTYAMATPDAGTWPERLVGVAWLAAAVAFVALFGPGLASRPRRRLA